MEQLRAKKLFERWQKTFLGAIDKQSEEYVLAMLREGEDLLARGPTVLDLNRSIKPASGSTFLHTAAWFQKARVLEWLLAHGADPNQGNLKGNTPLHLLAEQAAPDKPAVAQLIQCMLDYGADVHQKDATNLDAVDKARAGGFDIMSLSFEAGKEYAARKAAGLLNPAQAESARGGGGGGGAAAAGGASAAGGAPSGSGDSEDSSSGSGPEFAPLSESERAAAASKAALVYRKLSTLFLGLEAEGVSQAVDDAIVRILHANMHLVHHKLLELGRAPAESAGRTFLHLAVAARRVEIVRVLLLGLARNGPPVADAQDDAGDTALHLAVARIEEDGGAAIVALLLDAGASKTITNYLRGLTPFQMLPAAASPESKRWLLDYKPQLKIPPANALASKLLAAGASPAGAGGAAAGSAAIAGFGASGAAGSMSPEKQDRAGARALMARLASSVNSGAAAALAAGAGASGSGVEGLSAARSGALGLIKGSGVAGGGAGGGGLNARGSGGGVVFGGALASILAKNLGAGGAGAGGPKPPLPAGLASAVARARGSGAGLGAAAGAGLGLGGGKKGAGIGLGSGAGGDQLHRRLLLDELFDVLDLGSTHSLPAAQVGALHSALHFGCACPASVVQLALDSASPPGACTRANLLEVLAQLDLACAAHQALRWDFALLDVDGIGALSTAESSGWQGALPGAAAYASQAELVWQVNHADPAQTKFDEYERATHTKRECADWLVSWRSELAELPVR